MRNYSTVDFSVYVDWKYDLDKGIDHYEVVISTIKYPNKLVVWTSNDGRAADGVARFLFHQNYYLINELYEHHCCDCMEMRGDSHES